MFFNSIIVPGNKVTVPKVPVSISLNKISDIFIKKAGMYTGFFYKSKF